MALSRMSTRRQFLSKTAAVSLGAGAFPYFINSSVLAKPGQPGANDRIITGHIGVGGMGSHHLGAIRDQVGAVCDVDANHLKAAASVVGDRAVLYKDFRQMLERKDIDAVFIAAPDHWHGVMTVMACQAGKDVYCEKPASLTIAEGKAMIEAARRYGRIIQIGSQGRSTHDAYKTCEFIRNGEIGTVQKVTCWHYENPVDKENAPNSDPPPELDWDLWLGPARWVPYNKNRCHFNFRWFLDFGGGQIRDRGAHVMSVILWCLEQDHTGPVSVEATGEAPKTGIWDCPTTMEVTYQFKNPDWTLVWSQPGTKEGDAGFGAKYWGTKGEIVLKGGDGGCGADERVLNYKVPPGGQKPFRSPGHRENFFDCMRTRQKTIMNIEAGHRVATLCIIGNIAYRLGRKLKWDPVREQFIGDEEANRWLSNPGRGSWHL